MTETVCRIEDARAYPQGELFFLKGAPGSYEALVYNTTGLNRCPTEQFEAIDVDALRVETHSDVVWKNPRRFWMQDHLQVVLVDEPAEFQGLAFNCVAKMSMPANFDPAVGQSGMAYAPMQIRRRSVYEYDAGRPVFMLRSPDGITWVMQTYTTHIDGTLTESDLPRLAERLQLPAGWEFKAKKLDRELVVDTKGLAHIVPDDLENMYQGYDPDVFNYDPWV